MTPAAYGLIAYGSVAILGSIRCKDGTTHNHAGTAHVATRRGRAVQNKTTVHARQAHTHTRACSHTHTCARTQMELNGGKGKPKEDDFKLFNDRKTILFRTNSRLQPRLIGLFLTRLTGVCLSEHAICLARLVSLPCLTEQPQVHRRCSSLCRAIHASRGGFARHMQCSSTNGLHTSTHTHPHTTHHTPTPQH